MATDLRLLFLPALLAALLLAACGDGDSPQPGPTPAATSTPSATAPPSGVPAAPSSVRVSGALPDLRTPVPPGEGELGRITVAWQDNSTDETGFRVVQECQGRQEPLVEVTADETSYGPLQACRPGRIGVLAFNAAGASPITWTP